MLQKRREGKIEEHTHIEVEVWLTFSHGYTEGREGDAKESERVSE